MIVVRQQMKEQLKRFHISRKELNLWPPEMLARCSKHWATRIPGGLDSEFSQPTVLEGLFVKSYVSGQAHQEFL